MHNKIQSKFSKTALQINSPIKNNYTVNGLKLQKSGTYPDHDCTQISHKQNK